MTNMTGWSNEELVAHGLYMREREPRDISDVLREFSRRLDIVQARHDRLVAAARKVEWNESSAELFAALEEETQ